VLSDVEHLGLLVGNETQNASVLRGTASEKGKTRPIMAAQQRYLMMVVEV